MKNEAFATLSTYERLEKLRTALRNRTGDTLTDAELDAIARCVRLDRQYFVRVHLGLETLLSDLMYPGQIKASFLVGHQMVGQQTLHQLLYGAAKTEAAVTAVIEYTNGRSGIHIFLPASRNTEGSNTDER